MDSIRVGFIGAGRISDLHAIEYLNNPHATIVALCDRELDLAEGRRDAWRVEDAVITTDFHELLALEQVDLVEILLPHHLHVDAALAAFAAGEAVSLQKPMATTLEGADRLIAGTQRAGVPFRVFENFIFYPPVAKAKALVAAGAIGTPLTIRIKSNAGSRACAWEVPPGTQAWRADRAQAGGGPLVFDDGHHVDDEVLAERLPDPSLRCALAGAVLMDLALENRIDTDLKQLLLIDATPVGDDLIDPTLYRIAQERETHAAGYWVEHRKGGVGHRAVYRPRDSVGTVASGTRQPLTVGKPAVRPRTPAPRGCPSLLPQESRQQRRVGGDGQRYEQHAEHTQHDHNRHSQADTVAMHTLYLRPTLRAVTADSEPIPTPAGYRAGRMHHGGRTTGTFLFTSLPAGAARPARGTGRAGTPERPTFVVVFQGGYRSCFAG